MYCANCPSDATAQVIREDDPNPLPLCRRCADAYEWGQASPEAEVEDID